MIQKRTFSSVVIALSLIAFIGFSSCSKDKTVDKLIELTASQGNKACPMSINPDIRMDSIGHPGSKTLGYYYTLINVEKASYEGDINAMKQAIIEGVKTTPELEQLRKLDVSFRYIYFDKNAQQLADIEVTPADYK